MMTKAWLAVRSFSLLMNVPKVGALFDPVKISKYTSPICKLIAASNNLSTLYYQAIPAPTPSTANICLAAAIGEK